MSQKEAINVVSWVFGGFTTVTVLARLFTRTVLTRSAGWDDAFIILSLASALVCSSLVQIGTRYGLGTHLYNISDPQDRINAIKYTTLAPPFSVVSTTTGKISIVLFLFRLMGLATTKLKKWFLYILTILSVILNVFCIIVLIGFCMPATKIWDHSVPGHCMSLELQLVVGLLQASYNALTDFALAVFPAFVFWKVRVALRVKLTIILLMAAGLFAMAATIVKCVLLRRLPEQDDITWSWAPITIWYTIEMYIIIICASLPTLRQFYLFVLGRSLNSSSHGESYAMGHSGSQQPYPSQHSTRGSKFPKPRILLNDDTAATRHSRNNTSSSQENILPQGEILKTTEVRIQESTFDGQNSRGVRNRTFDGNIL